MEMGESGSDQEECSFTYRIVDEYGKPEQQKIIPHSLVQMKNHRKSEK